MLLERASVRMDLGIIWVHVQIQSKWCVVELATPELVAEMPNVCARCSVLRMNNHLELS